MNSGFGKNKELSQITPYLSQPGLSGSQNSIYFWLINAKSMKRYFLVLLLFVYGCNSTNTTKMNKPNFDSGYAPLGALKMYYEIHGKGGTPLVLLHGGGSTIRITFGHILDSLASDRQVIAVELQAHGRTRDIGKPTSFKQDADDVAALLKYLHIPKADVFGFSNGGHTTMQIGISHPEIVNKLIIASAFYRRDGAIPGFWDGFDHVTLKDMPAELKAAYLREDPDQEHLQMMFERDKTRMAEFKDWPDDDLRSIKAKTLILAGDHDVITPEHAVKMSHVIPQASLLIVPGNHGSFLGEVTTAPSGSKMPGLTVGLVKEFLDR
jgi:pimeloyl-ACP methyl ester carboxylesterase